MKKSIHIVKKEVKDIVEKHLLQCRRYLHNACESIYNKEYDKASEFLWGATAQAIKALAATKGITLKSSRKLTELEM